MEGVLQECSVAQDSIKSRTSDWKDNLLLKHDRQRTAQEATSSGCNIKPQNWSRGEEEQGKGRDLGVGEPI